MNHREQHERKQVPLVEIDQNIETQARVAISKEAIAEYAESLTAGDELPAVELFYDDSSNTYFVADGWHRFFAHFAAERETIAAVVKPGTLRDALFAAAGANKGHGVRRTNADKRRAVEILLKDKAWSKLSDRVIAEHCGVDHKTVANWRKPQVGNSPPEKRIGRDGKVQAARKSQPRQCDEVVQVANSPVDEALDFDPQKLEAEQQPLDIDQLATTYETACNALSRIKRDMTATAEDPRFGAHLHDKITRITTEIDDIRSTIKSMTPAAVCDGCEGDGCKACRQSGFLTKAIVESRKR